MEDSRIIELYWQRSENAITETDKKYGAYCNTVAFNILQNKEDADECVNDTWLGAWDAHSTESSDHSPCVPRQNHPQSVNQATGKEVGRKTWREYRMYCS